ncbi:MAG: homoserine dehydrogenase [Promethearchaeota archaeon]
MRAVLLGFGNVGQGTLRLIVEKQIDLEIIGIANSKGAIVGKIDPIKTLNSGITTASRFREGMSGLDLIAETDPEMIIEMTPTDIVDGGVGLLHMKKALTSGIHVVTSNKGPLALAFPELKTLAENNNLHFRYEATVAGAIPIFNLKLHCLPLNKVEQVHGILNGTTNYILNVMEERGGEMSLIIKEAQEKGYAEADPQADLEGIDAAIKLVIIANALLGRRVTLKDVYREGITNITPEAFSLASEHGDTIRLVASADDELLEVRPKTISKTNTLNIRGALNAIILRLDTIGDLTLIGPGAGGLETANAVINDILAITH